MSVGMMTIQSYFTNRLSFSVQRRHGLSGAHNAARDTRNKKQKDKIRRIITVSAFIQKYRSLARCIIDNTTYFS